MALFNVTSKPKIIQSFNSSTTTGDGCFTPNLAPFDKVLYHNGSADLPILGDTIYIDPNAITILITVSLQDLQLTDLSYLKTDVTGKRINLSC